MSFEWPIHAFRSLLTTLSHFESYMLQSKTERKLGRNLANPFKKGHALKSRHLESGLNFSRSRWGGEMVCTPCSVSCVPAPDMCGWVVLWIKAGSHQVARQLHWVESGGQNTRTHVLSHAVTTHTQKCMLIDKPEGSKYPWATPFWPFWRKT